MSLVFDNLSTGGTAAGGTFSAGMSNLGNTAGTTGIVNGQLVFVGGNNISLSQSVNGQSATITFNGGAAGSGLTNIKVSAGTLSQLRSDLTFADSNGLSFGLNTNGVLTGTVKTDYLTTAMASNRGSDFVQATAAFHGTNASGTIASNDLSVSVAAQTNQTVGLYASSNTYLTSSGTVDARSLSFRGDKSITVGVSNGEVAFSVGAYLTTAMASNRGSDFVQATAAFHGTNASGTIASNDLSISVAAQSVQSAIKAFGASNTGNTAGNTGVSTGIDWVVAGSNNITISESTAGGGPNTLWVSGPTTAAQTVQSAIKAFGASNTGNTAGNTGVSTGIDWVVAGSNNITISESTAVGGPNTLWVSGPTVGGAQTGISGIVVSDTTYTSGTVSFSNAGNITIASSVNGATQYIKLSGNAAQTTQSAIKAFGASNTGNTAGNTGVSTGIDWVLAGSNNITISESTAGGGPNTLWVSGPTTAAQSNQTLGFYASSNTTSSVSSGTFDARSMTMRGMGIASIGYSGGEIIVSVPSGGGGLTNINISGGTTSNLLSALTFADSNGVSWGLNASTITATVSTYTPVDIATQVYDVASANSTGTVTRWAPEDHRHAGVGAVGISTSGNTAGNTGSKQGTYWFEGGSNITLSQITSNNGSNTLRIVGASGGGAAMTFSAGTLTETLASLVFSDSNGVSFGLNGSTLTATVSTYSTVGTATTGYDVASANSVGTITRWAAEDHRHAGIGALGISTAGGTAGTTGSEQGTYWLQGGNNITISQITSNNGSHTAIISGQKHATASYFANLDRFIDAASTTLSVGVSALQVLPVLIPEVISGLFLRVPVSMSYLSTEVSGTTANTTWSVNRGYTHAVEVLTQLAGASSLSLGYLTSTSAVWTFQNVIGAGAQGSRYTVTQNVSYPISGTTSNYTTSYPQSSANVQLSSASMTLFTGPRFLDIPFGISLSPGNYWFAFGASTSSGTTGGGNAAAGNASLGFSTVGVSHSALSWGRPGEVTNSSIGIMPGLGSWSTNAAVMSTSSIQLASVSIQASHPLIYFQIQRFA